MVHGLLWKNSRSVSTFCVLLSFGTSWVTQRMNTLLLKYQVCFFLYMWMGSLGTSPVPVLLSLRREYVFTRESVLLTLGCLVFWLQLLITRWIVKGGCHCSLWHSSCALQIQVFLLLSKQTAALTLNQTEEILLPPWLFGSSSFVYKVSK